MSLLRKLFWISVIVASTSCKKKVPQLNYQDEHYCEKFAGKYDMYDPLNDVHYEMMVSCVLTDDEFYDTIEFYNYANRFDFRYRLGINGDSKFTGIAGVVIQPLKDHNNHKTTFGFAGFSYSPPQNILRNDSLYIVYSIDNMAYYMSDGVPYEQCNECLHYGVKVH